VKSDSGKGWKWILAAAVILLLILALVDRHHSMVWGMGALVCGYFVLSNWLMWRHKTLSLGKFSENLLLTMLILYLYLSALR
jgi:phosphatidylserine synthase